MFSLVFALAGALTLAERFVPARALPRVPNWWPRALFLQASVMAAAAAVVTPAQMRLLAIPTLLRPPPPLDHPILGGLWSYVLGSFAFYWWHRFRHANRFAWLAFHQLHHSPSRVQAATAFYVHPAEAIASSIFNAVWVLSVCGLGLEALAWNAAIMAAAGVFYHANLKTPRWVGLVVQRPEMHRYHHERGRHGGNYSDLPIWDRLFGTYLDPELEAGEAGFGEGRENEFWGILAFQDAGKTRRPSAALEAAEETA